MKPHPNRVRYILIPSLLVLAAAGVVGVAAVLRQRQGNEVPKVVSKVKDLEVSGVRLTREGEQTAALAIEIRNSSAKPVVAVSVESGDEKDASGVDINGDTSDGPPETIIEPYGTRTVEFPLSDVHPGKPVKVSGAVYADGSEDGEELSLRSMRQHRERDKAKHLKSKGGLPQQ